MTQTPTGLRTRALHSGINRAFGETSEALFLTASYAYDEAETAAAIMAGETPGHVYSRFSNPTVEAFEARLSAIEGAAWCSATATGMAAVTASLLSQLSAGDHIVSSRALFGSCQYVIGDLCTRFGIGADFVDGTDLDAWRAAVKPNTKVLFLETPCNPGLDVIDIRAVAEIARDAGARLIVDNVFATPVLQQPLALGADLVVYSATKHMDGQGRVLGGAILGHDPAFRTDVLFPYLRNTGPALSPFNAWVLLKSLETLALRVEAMSRTAAAVADMLAEEAAGRLAEIRYPFREDHPQADIARSQMAAGGSLVTIRFAGDDEPAQARAWRFMNALELFTISNNLGDAKSLCTHPRTTTHSRLTEEVRRAQNVFPGTVRLSCGLEESHDLMADLRQALDQAG